MLTNVVLFPGNSVAIFMCKVFKHLSLTNVSKPQCVNRIRTLHAISITINSASGLHHPCLDKLFVHAAYFYTHANFTTAQDDWLFTLHWRHNDHDGVSNHQPHGCLLNRLFRRRSKKTSKKCFHLITSSWCINCNGSKVSIHRQICYPHYIIWCSVLNM